MDITPSKRTRIVTLRKHARFSQRKIAETVGVSLRAVHRFLKQSKETGNVEIRREVREKKKNDQTRRSETLAQQQKNTRPASC